MKANINSVFVYTLEKIESSFELRMKIQIAIDRVVFLSENENGVMNVTISCEYFFYAKTKIRIMIMFILLKYYSLVVANGNGTGMVTLLH